MEDSTFYATAAQVLPVLGLVLLFEYHYFDQGTKPAPASTGLFHLSFLIALAGGELLALAALSDDANPTHFDFLVVSAALAWGVLGVFIRPFRHTLGSLRRTLPRPIVKAAHIASAPAFIAVALAATVLDSPAVIGGSLAALWLGALLGSWLAELAEGSARGSRRGRSPGKKGANSGQQDGR